MGNGIHRAFSNQSWDDFLDEIKDKQMFPKMACYYEMPMPLKASMLTNGNLARIIRDKTANDQLFWERMSSSSGEEIKIINDFVSVGFDYVLTTNYSYELECALLNRTSISQKEVLNLSRVCEYKNVQLQFLINTYNRINDTIVWHIHGESRKPDSMIIGHDNYGRLLYRCIKRLTGESESGKGNDRKGKEFKRNFRSRKPQKIGSWIDAFVLGDVYIVGFGMDLSEMDLWWLLEYKKGINLKGKTYFFELLKNINSSCLSREKDIVTKDQCKLELLSVLDAIINPFNDEKMKTFNSNYLYKEFYKDVLSQITVLIKGDD